MTVFETYFRNGFLLPTLGAYCQFNDIKCQLHINLLQKWLSPLESVNKTMAHLFANWSQFPCFLANCTVCVVLLNCALWMQWNVSPILFIVQWVINKQCWLRLKEVGEGFPIIIAFSKMAQNGLTVCLNCDILREICFNMHYLCCSYTN